MARIFVPSVYRKHTEDQSAVDVRGTTVRHALDELFHRFPALAETMVDEDRELRSYYNIYLGDTNIQDLSGLDTQVTEASEVWVLLAMAGGSGPLLSEAELTRYSRNILLGEVDVLGQSALKEARVLLIGAGGLGSPAALYLAAAGVGTLGVIDGDRVDLSNLQRQVLHTTADVGRPKVDSAREHLLALNPHIDVRVHPVLMDAQNALELIAPYDVIVNGCDNFTTRYVVNDACVILKKPLVDASILMWEAQASVYMPGKGCYRCLYPTPPPADSVPSCAEAGVIGAMAGHMGTWQALETVKIILGAGSVADDRLVLFNALAGTYRTLKRRRNPSCAVCGEQPTILRPYDLPQYCQAAPADLALELAEAPAPPPLPVWTDPQADDVRPADVASFVGVPDVQWIDVRESYEFDRYHIPGSRHIPMSEITQRFREIDPRQPAILVCTVGQRSARASYALRRAGFRRAYNLRGGLQHWINEQLPLVSGGAAR